MADLFAATVEAPLLLSIMVELLSCLVLGYAGLVMIVCDVNAVPHSASERQEGGFRSSNEFVLAHCNCNSASTRLQCERQASHFPLFCVVFLRLNFDTSAPEGHISQKSIPYFKTT